MVAESYFVVWYKVDRCLARYSPRATTTNQPTNRAPNEPLRKHIFGQKWPFLGQKWAPTVRPWWYWIILHVITLCNVILHGTVWRGLYLARHLSTLYNYSYHWTLLLKQKLKNDSVLILQWVFWFVQELSKNLIDKLWNWQISCLVTTQKVLNIN